MKTYSFCGTIHIKFGQSKNISTDTVAKSPKDAMNNLFYRTFGRPVKNEDRIFNWDNLTINSGFTEAPVIIVTIGAPGSGKSTLVAHEMATKKSDNWIVLNADTIRHELYGDEAIQGDPKIVFGLLYTRANEALIAGKNIIFDNTAITARVREPIIKLAQKHGAVLKALIMTTPLEECLKRNTQRERHVPEDVIQRMYASLEMPTKAEGFDVIIRSDQL